jgi:hypothetical protein
VGGNVSLRSGLDRLDLFSLPSGYLYFGFERRQRRGIEEVLPWPCDIYWALLSTFNFRAAGLVVSQLIA